MGKSSKAIKTKNTDNNEETNYEEELLFRQTNSWKIYSTTHDEIREEIRLDNFQEFNDEYGLNKESDLVFEQEDLTEDYLDSLIVFE